MANLRQRQYLSLKQVHLENMRYLLKFEDPVFAFIRKMEPKRSGMVYSYVMGIGEAEAFSERLKIELQALEAANVHTILENEPLVNQVTSHSFLPLLFSLILTSELL